MQGLALDDPYFLLELVAGELDKRGTKARDLAAIAFADTADRIAISAREQPLSPLYPGLSEILDDVARTCRDEGIAVGQFRRITFFEDEVNLQVTGAHGETEVFTWHIRPQEPR